MRLVVSNTGPLLHLTEAQVLSLLSGAGEIHIPKGVDTEMAQHDPTWQLQRPAWIYVNILSSPHDSEAAAWQQAGLLDAGEAEAIALATDR